MALTIHLKDYPQMSTIEIQTERLILRHPVMADAALITRGKQDVWPELQRWMSWAYDGEETLEATRGFIRALGPHSLLALCKETGRFVMMTGLTPKDIPDEYETGYWVAKEFLGKGYATEATCAAMHFGFDQLKAKKIHISHYNGNIKSRRIIEKLGFSHEIVKKNARKAIIGDDWQDSHEFTMTTSSALPKIEWQWKGQW